MAPATFRRLLQSGSDRAEVDAMARRTTPDAPRAAGWLRRHRTLLVVPALWLVAALSWSTASAIFTAKATNGANSFGAVKVTMTDDDGGSPLISMTGLRPGDRGARCYVVTYTGNTAALVKLYRSSLSNQNSTATSIRLMIDRGTGGTYAGSGPSDCGTSFKAHNRLFEGTLAGLGSAYGTGVDLFAASGSANQSASIRVRYIVDSSAPSTTRSSTVSVDLAAEAQNT